MGLIRLLGHLQLLALCNVYVDRLRLLYKVYVSESCAANWELYKVGLKDKTLALLNVQHTWFHTVGIQDKCLFFCWAQVPFSGPRAQSVMAVVRIKPVLFWLCPNIFITQLPRCWSSVPRSLQWKHGRQWLDRRAKWLYMVAKLGLMSRVQLDFICLSSFPDGCRHRYRNRLLTKTALSWYLWK